MHKVCTNVMMLCMRTTVSLDDGLAEDLKRHAAESRVSVSALVERLLREALYARPEPRSVPPFTLITVGGAPREGVDLDRGAKLLDDSDESSPLDRAGR